MTSAVCTLFEGKYHYGLAALSNSLYKSGFRGVLFAGYRGSLPPWVLNRHGSLEPDSETSSVFNVAEGFQICFIALDTDDHLTNYKPRFIIKLLDGPAKSYKSLFYFDPDICVVKRWTYFEEWVSCGVALCEDINSPLPECHPRRIGWRRHYISHNVNLEFRTNVYVNGGFIGITNANREFIETWEKLTTLMIPVLGSLSASKLSPLNGFKAKGFADCFDASDQDALNATIEATDCVVSIIGAEAMGFKPGRNFLPHAIGFNKPWRRNYVIDALRGTPPRLVDRLYWKLIDEPIKCYSPLYIILKRLELLLGSTIGRVNKRA